MEESEKRVLSGRKTFLRIDGKKVVVPLYIPKAPDPSNPALMLYGRCEFQDKKGEWKRSSTLGVEGGDWEARVAAARKSLRNMILCRKAPWRNPELEGKWCAGIRIL